MIATAAYRALITAISRQEEYDSMVQCEECSRWYHYTCGAYPDPVQLPQASRPRRRHRRPASARAHPRARSASGVYRAVATPCSPRRVHVAGVGVRQGSLRLQRLPEEQKGGRDLVAPDAGVAEPACQRPAALRVRGGDRRAYSGRASKERHASCGCGGENCLEQGARLPKILPRGAPEIQRNHGGDCTCRRARSAASRRSPNVTAAQTGRIPPASRTGARRFTMPRYAP